MKKHNYLPLIITTSLLLWCTLLFARVNHLINGEKISQLSAQIEFVFHFFMLVLVTNIFKRAEPEDRKIFLWLLIANICLFLNDFAFYLVVYFPNNYLINLTVISFIIDIIPYAIWVLAVIVFLSKILIKDIMSFRQFLKIFSALLIFNIIIIFLFLSSIQYAFGNVSWQSISQVLSSMGELIIFDLTILCLMYSENKGLSLTLSGFIVLISGDFIINYSFLSQTDTIETYGELLWFLGLILIFFGMLVLKQNRLYGVKDWLRKVNTIKSRLAFWSFSISVINILPFFILAYLFSPLSKAVFLILPPFIMITSVLVVILSLLTGKSFERPFKQITNNIESLMFDNDKSKINNNFSIEEFIYLQKFISDTYNIKEERDKAKKALGELTAQVAHDIRSPLAALDMIVTGLSDRATEQERTMMRTAFRRINNIANDLVARYKGKENHPDISLFIYVVLKDIVSEKDLEYGLRNTRFELILNDPQYAFLLIEGNYKEMRRMLSNLINNAVNAMPNGGTIRIACKKLDNNVVIMIRDQGCGLPQERIDKLLSENETQDSGIGLGLKHAKDYIKKHGGSFNLVSEEGQGTQINITFPILPKPKWLAEKLEVDFTQPVMIIDDDASIHEIWTKKFENFEVKREDYYSPLEAHEALRSKQSEVKLILCDYEFIGSEETGLDFLRSIQDIPAEKYLVTTHVDNEMILNECEVLNLQLIPKHLLPYVEIRQLNLNISLAEPQNENQIDAIFIDDEPYNHDFWQYAANKKKKTLLCFTTLEAFETANLDLPKTTPIYIDLNLHEASGLDVAQHLHSKGFIRLYIATGYADFNIDDHPYLAGVQGKDPPF